MLIDARVLPDNSVVAKDICIVGGGAAGITLAREFSNHSMQVCLLESGGLEFDEVTQSLYGGDNIGIPYYPLQESRARYLGGSTNLWGGWSRPLDEIDFEERSWMPYSGWPFTRAALDPYYERAQTICHLGPFEYDFAYWEKTLTGLQRQQPEFASDQIITCLWQIIPPAYLRFGKLYKADLEEASNIDTFLHANAVELEVNESAQAITRLRVTSTAGKTFWVAAKVFILAAGGIENPRLLLASNQLQTAGLGNQYDLVGRFFMEHPYLISGSAELFRAMLLYTQRNFQVGGMFMGSALGLTKAAQEQEQLLNFAIRLLPMQEEWIEAFNRISFRNQYKTIHKAFPTIHEGHKVKQETGFLEDLGKVITNWDRIAAKVYAKLFGKHKAGGLKFPSRCDTHLISEQAPNPDSRVILSRERDRFGLNRVQLDWRLSPIDRHTILRSQQLITEVLESSGLGRIHSELTDDQTTWQSLTGSYHHMGTTRMSRDPKQGVVNEHCQVHGIHNLFIAGSSVFPTSGLSNPTLTIIALAVRLADYLKEGRYDSLENTRQPAFNAASGTNNHGFTSPDNVNN